MTWAMWITGLPGSGKSALARAASAALQACGEPATVLELDEIRRVLTPRPRYTDAEREVVYRALVEMARLLTEAGVAVIVDATAHRRAWRDMARASIRRFAEVQVVCPLEVARQRERVRAPGAAPRGVYARAGRPGAAVPGVDVAYEPALHPECVVDTSREDLGTAVARVVGTARRLALGRHEPPPERVSAWTLLMCATVPVAVPLPRALASALAARRITVKVLELSEIRQRLLGGVSAGRREEEIVERALVYMARLLNRAGVAVVVDARGGSTGIGALARQLLARYAEVWLVASGDSAIATAATRRPDLVLEPDRQDAWTLLEETLFLARRLHRRAAAFPSDRERRTTCKSES